MRHCSFGSIEHFKLSELPILPCFAPRVFTTGSPSVSHSYCIVSRSNVTRRVSPAPRHIHSRSLNKAVADGHCQSQLHASDGLSTYATLKQSSCHSIHQTSGNTLPLSTCSNGSLRQPPERFSASRKSKRKPFQRSTLEDKTTDLVDVPKISGFWRPQNITSEQLLEHNVQHNREAIASHQATVVEEESPQQHALQGRSLNTPEQSRAKTNIRRVPGLERLRNTKSRNVRVRRIYGISSSAARIDSTHVLKDRKEVGGCRYARHGSREKCVVTPATSRRARGALPSNEDDPIETKLETDTALDDVPDYKGSHPKKRWIYASSLSQRPGERLKEQTSETGQTHSQRLRDQLLKNWQKKIAMLRKDHGRELFLGQKKVYKTSFLVEDTGDGVLHSTSPIPGDTSIIPLEFNIPAYTADEIYNEWPSLRAEWLEISSAPRIVRWPKLMLRYLESSPKKALAFLQATLAESIAEPHQIADALDLICCDADLDGRTEYHSQLFRVFHATLKQHTEIFQQLSQRTILVILTRCVPQVVHVDFFANLMKDHISNSDLHYTINLRLAQLWIESGNHDEALLNLYNAVKGGANPCSTYFLKCAARFLYETKPKHDQTDKTSQVLASLVDIGMPFNNEIYSSIMAYAADLGDLATVLRIYNSSRNNGILPNSQTYVTMLRAARTNASFSTFRTVFRDFRIQRAEQIESFHVTRDLRNAILLSINYWSFSKKRFANSLRVYENYFDLEPLKLLGLVEANHAPRMNDSYKQHVLDPDYRTIEIMIFSFLAVSNQSTCDHIYKRFRQLVHERHPFFVPLAARHFIYHAFLNKIMKTFVSPLHWKYPLAHMSSLLPNTIDPDTGKQFVPPQPDHRTYEIIIKGLAKRGRFMGVQRVVNLMTIQNIELDIGVWNLVVQGQSRAQRLDLLRDTLSKILRQGLKMDEETLAALQRVRDQPKLLQILQSVYSETEQQDGGRLGLSQQQSSSASVPDS